MPPLNIWITIVKITVVVDNYCLFLEKITLMWGNYMKLKNKTEKRFFDFLLKLAYFDFGQDPEISTYGEVSDPFISLLFEYSRFLGEFESKYPFIKAEEKYNHLISGLLDPSSYVNMPHRIEFFREVQQHLQSQVEKIMAAESTELNKAGAPLISMKGNQEIYYDSESGTFTGMFRPVIKKEAPAHELDSGEEKQLLDLILSEIMLNSGLRADRFRKCERCSNIFYQYTANEKIYCSTRCSNAERQLRHSLKKLEIGRLNKNK